MLDDDIADLLTSGGFATDAIFIAELPERPAEATVVTMTGGLGSTRTMSATPADAPLEDVRVQIRTRGDGDAGGYSAARQLIHDAHAILDGMAERTINGRRYYSIVAIQSPFYLGRDEEFRPMFSCNYQVLRAESTA